MQPAAGTTAAVVDKTELQSQNPSTTAPVKEEGGGGEHSGIWYLAKAGKDEGWHMESEAPWLAQ